MYGIAFMDSFSLQSSPIYGKSDMECLAPTDQLVVHVDAMPCCPETQTGATRCGPASQVLWHAPPDWGPGGASWCQMSAVLPASCAGILSEFSHVSGQSLVFRMSFKSPFVPTRSPVVLPQKVELGWP